MDRGTRFLLWVRVCRHFERPLYPTFLRNIGTTHVARTHAPESSARVLSNPRPAHHSLHSNVLQCSSAGPLPVAMRVSSQPDEIWCSLYGLLTPDLLLYVKEGYQQAWTNDTTVKSAARALFSSAQILAVWNSCTRTFPPRLPFWNASFMLTSGILLRTKTTPQFHAWPPGDLSPWLSKVCHCGQVQNRTANSIFTNIPSHSTLLLQNALTATPLTS
jgi:hypothetical protein